jgi:hypothetical protein
MLDQYPAHCTIGGCSRAWRRAEQQGLEPANVDVRVRRRGEAARMEPANVEEDLLSLWARLCRRAQRA